MTHLYHRNIESETNSSLHAIAAWLEQDPGPVLDIGMGTGSLGRLLARRLGGASPPIDGVTHQREEACLADGFYREVYVLDLDAARLADVLQTRAYRWIVCADVLEHLRNPEQVLHDAKSLLGEEGELLLSVPNVAYAGLLAELLQGRWVYRDEGLLDRTHLRFFTLNSLQDWLSAHGWQALELKPIKLPIAASEFRPNWEALPERLRRHLLRQPHALTYQFVLRCVPTVSSAAQQTSPLLTASDTASPRAEATFAVELFFDEGQGFREDFKSTTWAELGNLKQTIILSIPTVQEPEKEHYRRLRLDPSDRPGLLILLYLGLRIHGDSQTCLTWSAEDEHAIERLREWSSGTVLNLSPALMTSQVILVVGDDAQIQIPLTPTIGERLARYGGELTVTFGSAGTLEGWALARSYTEALKIRHQFEHLLQTAREKQAEIERLQTLLRERDLALQTMRLAWQNYSSLINAAPSLSESTFTSPSGDRGHPACLSPLADVVKPGLTTIIVPVYRGLHETQRCLQSVIKTKVSSDWQLIIIDDCSPEPELTIWLQTFVGEHTLKNIRLIRHDTNLGFVRSVNEGIELAAGTDIVLLNSDTEVTDGWLDRLRAACYRQADVGTATPWSNHATLFSYPCWPEGGTLPPGWTAGELAQLCAHLFAGQTLDVPTAHGFCMYIKAACLASTGSFDAEAFGHGYGEENDFCLRASKLGWRHVHALDTFVFHRGSVSFGAEREQRVQKAIEIIRQRYPDYESTIYQLIRRDPWEKARRVLDLARFLHPTRSRILLISHDGTGGADRHQHELAEALGHKASFIRLQPYPEGVIWYVMSGKIATQRRWHYRLPDEYRELVLDLKALGIQQVHFHHWQGLPLSIFDLPRHLGVPYDVTVHDHYSYCPQIHLSQNGTDYCGEQGTSQCQRCLQQHPAPDGTRDIQAWRARHAALLLGARYVIAPSRDVAQRLQRYFGVTAVVAAHDELTHGHAHCWPEPRAFCDLPSFSTQRRLRVAVLGALSPIKGADLLEATAALAARESAPVEFHLLGYAYRSLRTAPRTALICHGRYDDEDLQELLAWLQPDLIWLPARVSETYSYTLSAALAAGLPVAATDLGALAERLHGRPWSWLLPVSADARAWLDLFLHIREQHLVRGLKDPVPVARSAQHAAPSAVNSPDSFDYQRQYLPPPIPNSAQADPLCEEWMRLGRHQPPAAARRRLWLLGRLAALRSAPLLRGVAARIPAPVQRRIKRWLLR